MGLSHALLTMLTIVIWLCGAEDVSAQRRMSTPDTWITAADYPDAAMKAGQIGAVTVEYEILEDGSIGDCTVEFAEAALLGETTCELVRQRARYQPAYDTSGNPVRSRDGVSVRWALPPQNTVVGSTDFGGAMPKTSPGSWITADSIGRLDERQNAVALEFAISSKGRAIDCVVVETVGDPALGPRACKLFLAKARFISPVDENGEPFATRGRTIVRHQEYGR